MISQMSIIVRITRSEPSPEEGVRLCAGSGGPGYGLMLNGERTSEDQGGGTAHEAEERGSGRGGVVFSEKDRGGVENVHGSVGLLCVLWSKGLFGDDSRAVVWLALGLRGRRKTKQKSAASLSHAHRTFTSRFHVRNLATQNRQLRFLCTSTTPNTPRHLAVFTFNHFFFGVNVGEDEERSSDVSCMCRREKGGRAYRRKRSLHFFDANK